MEPETAAPVAPVAREAILSTASELEPLADEEPRHRTAQRPTTAIPPPTRDSDRLGRVLSVPLRGLRHSADHPLERRARPADHIRVRRSVVLNLGDDGG